MCSPETQPSHILANVPYRPSLAKPGRRAPRRWGWGSLVERTPETDALLPQATGHAFGDKTEEPQMTPQV